MGFKIDWSGRAVDYTEEEISKVVEVMKNADPQTQGPYLKKFEADFGEFVGASHCFGVTNCTNALELIADLTGLKEGDEVIIPGHTYCASAIPFGRTGATIKWADIDPETFLISLDSIKKLTCEKTKVIVVVHLYGQLCEIEEISAYAKSQGIYLIEDCAQSLGAVKKGQNGGTFGDFGAYSFHAQKNITTLGEGGMLVVKDPVLARLVPGLRHNGHRSFQNQVDYWLPAMSNVDLDLPPVWPHNFCLSEVQAALGSILLKRLKEMNEERRIRALRFQEELNKFDELVFQKTIDPKAHSFHLLVAKYKGNGKKNHDLIRLLSEKYKIKVIVQFYPLYRYDLFKKMGAGDAICPYTDDFYDNMISFPFHLWISDEDFEYLIESTKSALRDLQGLL
jgi:perosamine synthetase